MGTGPFDVLPLEHRDPAYAALTAAIDAPVHGLAAISGGASGALTYRVEAGERSYLLRLETARDPFRNPLRSYGCMRAAATAGLAPPLHHADPEAGIAIMDFVAARPLEDYPGGAAACMVELGRMVARLQTTPLFPPMVPLPDMLAQMLQMIADAPLFRAGALAPHLEALRSLRQAYPWASSPSVSSHNDLNCGNVLFDGERLWMIDWELSFCNDALFDPALLALNFAATPSSQHALLAAYLGHAPDAEVRARFALMRTFAMLFYACLMLSMCIGRVPQEDAAPAMDEDELRRHVASGQPRAGPLDPHRDGKVLLAGFLTSWRSPALQSAMRDARGP